MEKSTDLVPGTLDLLILKTVALQPMHGWGIGLRIQQISAGRLEINQGSLYPAPQRLDHRSDVRPNEVRRAQQPQHRFLRGTLERLALANLLLQSTHGH